MTRPSSSFSLLLFVISLGISQPALSQTDATAEYSVKFTGNWTLTSTPGGVVGGAHFTTIAGGKHNSSVSFWKSGEKATSGLESLAEIGATSGFLNEINASSHTDASFTSSVGGGGTGTSTFTLNMKKTHPLVTLASMIGPSPDWFVGLSSYSLLDSSSNWVSSVTVNLYPYDAGTENGEEFSLSNPATNPQGNITSIRGVGKFSNAPMATIAFTRQDTPPPSAPSITAIERSTNANQYTNSDSVTWLITFSEVVQNVSTDDFVVSGTTASVTSVSLVSGSTTQYRVVVSGGNLADLNATISLGLASSQDITNSSNVALSSSLPISSQTYFIDNAGPRVSSVAPSSAEESPFTATIVFNEAIRTDSFGDEDDVTSDDAEVSNPSGSGSSFRVTVMPHNPSQSRSIVLSIPAGAAIDLAGNPSTAHEATIDYVPDLTRIPPVVNSVAALSADGLYHVDDEIEIGVSFSQSVDVTGTPMLMLQFDSGAKPAPYDRGSGSASLVFSYTLVKGDATADLKYADILALDLAGGTILGAGGRAANLRLPTPGSSGSLSQSSNIMSSGRQNAIPSFGDASIEDQVLMMNQQIDAIQLPGATGGDAPLEYELEPNLPVGLQLDAMGQAITGTPTTELDQTTFTWTVTDADGDVARLTFTIMILPELPLQFPQSAMIGDQVLLQNEAIEPIELPAARGGNGEISYSLEPALPQGLTSDLEARHISGTPTEVLPLTTFSWRASDEEGAMVELDFNLTVLEDFQPVFDTTLANIDERFVQGSAIEPVKLPSASNGNGQLVYELKTELPEGLVLDTTSFEITGTPLRPTSRTLFAWTVTDEDGDSATFDIYITVLEDFAPSFAADASVSDQVFTSDSVIEPIRLPAAMGGNRPLRYVLSPDLPSGIELDTTSLEISGTPQEATPRTLFTWSVHDVDGDSESITFYLTVMQDVQPMFNERVTNKVFEERTPIEAFSLPSASGGNGQLAYQLSPALPDGIRLDNETALISGTPTGVFEATEFSWTATDEDGDHAALTFTITVQPRIPLHFPADTSIQDQVFLQNDAIAAIELPAAMGGFGGFNYSLTPDLPAGLVFDPEMLQITGTPTEVLDQTEFTWRVTDADGVSVAVTFSITVLEDLQPVFDVVLSPIDEHFIQHSPITPFTLPSASSGNGELEYELATELPDGLVLNETSFEITGIPTVPTERMVFGWTVTDEDGDSITFSFHLTVLEDVMPSFAASTSITDQEFISDSAIEPFRLPTAMGGNGTLSYGLSPELPNGLELRPLLNEVSGIPTTAQERTQFTWTATDSDGDVVSIQFYITVIQDTQPVFDVVLSPIDERFIQHSPITPFTLPSASSGNGELEYELATELPDGLVLNETSFEVTGIPTVPADRMTFDWSVTDEDGDSVTFSFHLTVLEDVMPSFTASTSITDQEFISDSAIEPFRLPTAMGGNGTLSYRLSPELPNGLELRPLLNEVSGIPTTAQERTQFTWTATDTDGDVVSIQFHITVIQDTQPVFSARVEDKVFVMGMPIATFTLPEATGGNGVLTYELSPQPANGMSFDAGTASISGTPNTESPTSTFKWTVTDVDGDTVTLTFSITVNPAPPTVVGSIASVRLFVGGSPQMIDATAAIEGRVDTWGVEVSNNDVVSGSLSAAGVLTLSPLFEGQSSVMVTASNLTGTAQFSFTVSVVTDSAENDQIDTALSLKAGAILSSAMNVFKHRTHSHDTSSDTGRAFANGFTTVHDLDGNQWSVFQDSNPHRYEHSLGSSRQPLFESTRFTFGNDFVPLNFSHTSTRWRMWGAVDLQNFSSEAPQNEVDGSLSSLYLGADLAVNENTFGGLAVARHSGSGSYEFSSSAANGGAEIETTLISFYPYLQAGDGDRFSMFLVGGIGYGDTEIDRRHTNGSDDDADTDMTLFAGGFDYVVLRRSNIDFSIVGDAGVATLTTAADAGVLAGRDSSSSKSSIGGSVSFNPQIEGGSMVTSVDLRLANGAEGDKSGSGFELGANLNFIGEHIDFMLDGRTMSRSADADLQRSSISGRLRYKAKTDGAGLTVTLSPKWQDGSLLDMRKRFERTVQPIGIESLSRNNSRSLEAEVGYGFWTHDGTALFKPRLAWHNMGVNEKTIKLGSTWQFLRSSKVGPVLSADLLRETTDCVGESFGVIARIDLLF